MSMESIQLSVIVPVYRAEKYLHRCLSSLVTSSKEVEIIIVNDGSPDSSEPIILEFLTSNSNMKYIKKENGGVSSARNLGILNSTGRFITFVDADDFVSDNYYDVILSVIKNNKDLYCLSYYVTYDQVEKIEECFANESEIDGKSHLGIDWYIKQNNDEKIKQFCLNKIYKAEIIKTNQILFPIGQTVGEDYFFNIHYLEFITNIQFNSVSVYHYYQSPDSVMRTYNRKYTEDIMRYSLLLKEVASHSGYELEDEDISYLLLKCWFGVLNQEKYNSNGDAEDKVKSFLCIPYVKNMKVHNKLSFKYFVYFLIIKMHLTMPFFKLLRHFPKPHK